ncbi:hypothetical protein O7621_24225 [Solwaraspora sp. WMMD937]|uniref:hypothetical protein n=1 Tax=Solwaraspora sp. WMMD937 TaxID=3016090 RepID=UPI00249C72FA|nr:hypothetical protein [Solwaraspora sp. WMMD937]WFE20943.1 hypothetical protein O7621_24225 [Solwaraspora sp. WMMD937]
MAAALFIVAGVSSLAFRDQVLNRFVVDLVVPVPVPILVPVVVGMAVGLGAASQVDRRILPARSMVLPRVAWATVLLLTGLLTVLPGVTGLSATPSGLARNCLAFSALGLASTVWLGAVGAWVGPALVGLFVILFGGGRPEGLPVWAFFLSEEGGPAALVGSVVGFVLAVVLYSLAGTGHVRITSGWT